MDFYNSYNSQKSRGLDWFPLYSHPSVTRSDSHRIKLLDPASLETDHPSAVYDNTDRDPAVWIRDHPQRNPSSRFSSRTAFINDQPQRSLSFAKGDNSYGLTVHRPQSLYNTNNSAPQRSQSMYVTDGSSTSIDKRPYVIPTYSYQPKRSQSMNVSYGPSASIDKHPYVLPIYSYQPKRSQSMNVSSGPSGPRASIDRRPYVSSRSLYQEEYPMAYIDRTPHVESFQDDNEPRIEVPLRDNLELEDNNAHTPSTGYPYNTKLELPYPYTGSTKFKAPQELRQTQNYKVNDANVPYMARLPVPVESRTSGHARHGGESLDNCLISFRSYPSPVPEADIALYRPKLQDALGYDEVDSRLKSRSQPDLSRIYTTSLPRTSPVKKNTSHHGKTKETQKHKSKVFTSNPHFTDVDKTNPGNRKRQIDKPQLPVIDKQYPVAGQDTIDGSSGRPTIDVSSGHPTYRYPGGPGSVPNRHLGGPGQAEDRSQGSSEGLYNYDQQQDEIYYPPKSTFRL